MKLAGCAALAAFATSLWACGDTAAPPTDENFRETTEALCSGVSLTATPESPVPLNATMSLGATASCDGVTEYKFAWQSDSASAYGIIRDYDASNTTTWNTAGFSGRFNLYGYARSVGTANWSRAILSPVLIGRVCDTTALEVTPPPVSGESPALGTLISLSATATCRHGGTPEHQFFYSPPGSTTLVQILASECYRAG